MSSDLPTIDGSPSDPLPTGWRVPLSLMILAGPIIGMMISRTVMSFADFIMVSKISDDAMAAVMPAGISVWCMVCFGFGVVTVTNTFVSQALGRGELSECSRYSWQGLYLAGLLGLFVLPAWWLAPWYFEVAGHAPEVQRLEIIYFRVSLFGIMPAIAANVVTNFFNGVHRPSVGLAAAVIANSFNIGANYILIFGKFGFPEMGIAGAAWATTASSTLQILILFAIWMGPFYAQKYASRTTWRPSWSRLKRIIRVGLPVGVHFQSELIGFTVFTVFMVGKYGTAQMAANNLAFKFLEIAFMPVVGLSIALTAAVGKAIGRGQPDHARLLTRWTLGGALCYMMVIASIYFIFRFQLPGLIRSDLDPQVVEWAAKLLVLCAIFQIFDAFGITMSGALRGAGDTFWPGMTTFFLTCTVFLGGGYLMMHFAPGLQSIGPWIAATVYICTYGVVMAMRWWLGPWEKIDIFKEKTTKPKATVEPA